MGSSSAHQRGLQGSVLTMTRLQHRCGMSLLVSRVVWRLTIFESGSSGIPWAGIEHFVIFNNNDLTSDGQHDNIVEAVQFFVNRGIVTLLPATKTS